MGASLRWRVLLAAWARPLVADPLALSLELRAATGSPARTLRDDRRSRVLLLASPPAPLATLAAGPWVMKRPVWRDGRWWNRLASLLAAGEMRRSFAAGLRLLSLGIATPRPLLLLEGRRRGVLVESWLAYEFVTGQPVEERHWSRVVETLRRLHQVGLRHGDPHLANWLATDRDDVVMLDPAPRPLRRWCADDAYDFVLLRNCAPAILPLLPGVGTTGWRLAEARNAWVQGWRRLKRNLRVCEKTSH
jgi:hypothetical protein